MFPKLGPLPFPNSYGLLVAAGLLLMLWLVRRQSPRVGVSGQQAQDVLVWSCLAGLVGAKALLFALEPSTYFRAPWKVVMQGGVFYGGLIAGVVTLILLCLRRGIEPNALGDACASAVPLGHALGRIGCFLAGCCWGSACDLPWAVTYTHPDATATAPLDGLAVHPVQLYEAFGNLLLAGLAFLVFRHRRFVGQAWWTYAGGYAVLRFLLEGFRGDPRGDWFGGLFSTSQVIALLALTVAAAMMLIQWRRAPLASPVVPIPAGPGEDGEAPVEESA